jgi:signal transduction histidine kinase
MMKRRSPDTVVASMPLARLLSRPHIVIALGYIAGYVALDWISYVHPFTLSGITPWNPQTGLSFALILLFGLEFLPWLYLAPMAADFIVRGFSLPGGAELLIALVIGSGYGAATIVLLSQRVMIDPTLNSMRSLLWLMATAAASIGVVAAGHVAVLVAFGIFPRSDILAAVLSAFVGDVIGVTVFTPFLLIFLTRRRSPDFSWEALTLLSAILATIWIVFGLVDAYRLQLFYLLFIPIIWAAVRFGLFGVTAVLVVTQVGLIAAIQLSGQNMVDVTSYQALMVVLAVTGLALGVLVNEQERAQRQLRLQQETMNRASRLGAMGEFAAAVAHEINQPLTAIANYARLAKRAVVKQPPDLSGAIEAASSAVEQVDRAAQVVRRLRDFIRLGRSEVSPAGLRGLAAEAYSFCRPDLDRRSVDVDIRVPGSLHVLADTIQIQQVLINLLLNSAEALAQAGRSDGRIVVEAEQITPEMIGIRVCDNGPGFDFDSADHAMIPFATTKPGGLGLGLSLARSIVEAHSGKLSIESGPRGATVAFTLKSAIRPEMA